MGVERQPDELRRAERGDGNRESDPGTPVQWNEHGTGDREQCCRDDDGVVDPVVEELRDRGAVRDQRVDDERRERDDCGDLCGYDSPVSDSTHSLMESARNRSGLSVGASVMRVRGLEPPRAEAQRDLNPSRLPIAPHPRSGNRKDDGAAYRRGGGSRS